MPHRVDPVFLDLIHAAGRDRLKISIFDAQGRLLWYSPEWAEHTGPAATQAEALGVRWLDFVHPEDAPAARAWILSPIDGLAVWFRAHSANAADLWLEVAMVKRRAGAYWVATGDNRIAPVPSCVIYQAP